MSHVPFIPASDQNMERVAAALESMAGNPMIAENYDNTSTYDVGEHARHDGLLYKCITPITTAESWNASHWQEVKLADEIEDQNEKIGGTNLPTVAQTLTGAIAEQNNNIAKLQEGIAIIVDEDTASVAVPVGGYAYVKNNTHGLSEGLYKNTSSAAFPVSGGTADSTVFTAVPTGAVNDAVTALNNILTQLFSAYQITTKQYDFIPPSTGTYLLYTSGGGNDGMTNTQYGCVILVITYRQNTNIDTYAILHKGSAITISTTTNSITLSCSATTLAMGYIKIGAS